MVKKLLALFCGLVAASCMMAQSGPKSVTINESDIQYWTGSGSNSSVVAIGWDDDDASYTPTVVVWGIHWSGTITLLDALDTLMAYDSRFSYTISGSFLSGVTYNDPNAGVVLTPSAGWNCNNYKGAKLVRDMLKSCTNFKEYIIMNTSGLSSLYANEGGIIVVY